MDDAGIALSFVPSCWQAGGKNPVWNEEHAFEISSEKEAMIEVFDKENVGQDKFMGELKVLERLPPHNDCCCTVLSS